MLVIGPPVDDAISFVGGGVLDTPQVCVVGILIFAVRSCYFVGRGLAPSFAGLPITPA